MHNYIHVIPAIAIGGELNVSTVAVRKARKSIYMCLVNKVSTHIYRTSSDLTIICTGIWQRSKKTVQIDQLECNYHPNMCTQCAHTHSTFQC